MEIRILDGILKLLNAICSTPILSNTTTPFPNLTSNPLQTIPAVGFQSCVTHQTSTTASQSTTASSNSSASQLISSLDSSKFDASASDGEKCTSIGTAIAHALMSSRSSMCDSNSSVNSSSSFSSSSSSSSSSSNKINPLFDSNSPEYNHVMQILNACKCLFVSHRKIAIYLQHLNEMEKKSRGQQQQQQQHQQGGVLNENTSILNENVNANMNLINNQPLVKTENLMTKTCKLTLSEIRIPLSWKWADHLKASKNAGSISL